MILNVGSHLKALTRTNTTDFMHPQIAMPKAWGLIGLGDSSQKFGEMGKERPMFMNVLINIAQ